MGLRSILKKGKSTPAATGIKIVLYAKAQKRFCLIFRMVALLNVIAVTTPLKSPLIRVISADSMATSVPVPRAMPISACAKAGASFIPSPTIATIFPSAWSFFTSLALSCGSTSAKTRFILTSRAIASAVLRPSPVIIIIARPRLRKAAMASLDSGFKVSATAMIPAIFPFTAMNIGVFPSPERSSDFVCIPLSPTPFVFINFALPRKTSLPRISASIP